MRVVGIDDLVLDYYYNNGKLIAVDGGISVHNIIANLSSRGIKTCVIAACGSDIQGDLSIDSLKQLDVDTSYIEKYNQVKTRNMHVNFINGEFTSKRKCPICGKKEWYSNSLLSPEKILNNINSDDILLFAGINPLNKEVLDKCNNNSLIDIGYYNEFEDYSDEYILDFFKRKFLILNINERVDNYLKERFPDKNIYNGNIVIITRGKEGADFIYNGKIIKKQLIPTKEVDPNGAGDVFFSSIIYDYFTNKDFDVDNSYKNATKLASIVVKSLGARGHLHDLYEVEKEDNKCTCETFKIKKKIRKERS